MAVVINEFEVVAEEAPMAGPPAQPAETHAPKTPEVGEIQRVERFLEERARRVWAH